MACVGLKTFNFVSLLILVQIYDAAEVDSHPNSLNNGIVKSKYKANSGEMIHK